MDPREWPVPHVPVLDGEHCRCGDAENSDRHGVDVTRHLAPDELAALFAAFDGDDAQAVNEALDRVEAAVKARSGNGERLKHYWAFGEGAAKVRWGTDGAFDRCVEHVSKYLDAEKSKGFCNYRYHDATGRWPGQAHHKGADSRKHEAAGMATEAQIAGRWSYSDIEEMVRDALRDEIRGRPDMAGRPAFCRIVDLTSSDVVYADDFDGDDLWQRPYTVDGAGRVTLGGPAERVVRSYAPAPAGMPPDLDLDDSWSDLSGLPDLGGLTTAHFDIADAMGGS